MEEFTWEDIKLNINQHMERGTTQNMEKMMSQPLPYSLAASEKLHSSHFNPMTKVHDGGGKILICILHSLIYMSSISYQEGYFLLAYYILMYLRPLATFMMAILFVDCGGMPHGFRCASLAPNYDFMASFCKMNVVENKWLKRHLFHYDMR